MNKAKRAQRARDKAKANRLQRAGISNARARDRRFFAAKRSAEAQAAAAATTTIGPFGKEETPSGN